MSLVLDSSVTLAWVYGEERNAAIRQVFERISMGGAWVPSLWRLEVANVLEMGVRRRRHDAIFFRNETVTDLMLLPIALDGGTDRQAWGGTAALAERRRLTLYDAAYLEVALLRSLPLATLDIGLRTAAASEKVELLGL